MKKLEMYLGEAISNIREDRKTTKKLLKDLVDYMSSTNNSDKHREVGQVASKYVETLQRSNEQLVKIVSLLHKKQSQDRVLHLILVSYNFHVANYKCGGVAYNSLAITIKFVYFSRFITIKKPYPTRYSRTFISV